MTGTNVFRARVRHTLQWVAARVSRAARLSAVLLAFAVLAPAAFAAQVDQTLSEALAESERVPVIVTFDLPVFEADGPAAMTDAVIDARISQQRDIIERAIGVPAETLAAPTAQAARLRREFRSVAMVSMYLTAGEIDALLADPSVSDVQLDQVVPPTTNGTIPLIGASTLHTGGLTGSGATIAILDSGVDHEHPMFAGRIVASACFSSTVGTDATSFCPAGAASDTTTADAGDDCPYTGDTETAVAGCGHGTHVAGIAAGSSFLDTGTGDTLIGVAPGASIVAVQVFSRFTNFCTGFGLPTPCALTYTSDQIAALDWIYTNRATLGVTTINMSLGGGRNYGYCNADARYTVINNLRTENIATVVASGNSGYVDSISAPACVEPAIAVGATNDSDVVASFSNSATILDLLAPGVAINSAEPTVNDTLPGRARSIQGTSMASPHVAGAFALLRAANPSATVQDIETALENTGVAVTEPLALVVKPRIRVNLAHAALDTAAPTIASITRQTPSTSPTNADSVIWRVTFSELVSNVDTSDFTITGTTGTVSSVTNPSGNAYDVTVSGGDMSGLNATVTLGFAGGQNITDIAGNALANTTPTGANDNTYVIDNAAPTLTAFARNTPAGEKTNADTLVFAISFNETVTNVSADDFTISGTTATGVLAGSGSSYTLTLSGGDLASLTGTVGLNLAGGQNITDTVGHALGAGEPATDQTFDVRNIAPQIASIERATPATSVTNGDSLTWRFTFAQIDNSFSLPTSAFTVTGTTATVTSVSRFSIGFDVTVSGGDLASLNGDVSIGLTNSNFADDYGNVMDRTIPAGAELTYSLDNTGPRIASIERFSPTAERASNDTVRWRVTFNEAVNNVTADDFTVTGTTGVLSVSNLTTTTVDLDLSGGDMAGLNGTVTLAVAGGQDVADSAGNLLTNTTPTGANDNTFVMDNTPPRIASVVRQSSASQYTNLDSITWRVTFNEDVSGVDATKFGLTVPFDVNSGSITQSVAQISASVYDVTAAGGDLVAMNGEIALRIFTTVNDLAFNTMTDATPTGASELSYTVDNAGPDAFGIYRANPTAEATNADTLQWAISVDPQFSGDVFIDASTVNPADFTLTGPTGATLSISVVTNAGESTATIFVTASGGDLASYDGTVALGIAPGQDMRDLAGNPVTTSLANGSQSFSLDNTVPTLVSLVRQSPAGTNTNADSLTWRVTFSETVATVDATDFSVTGTTAQLSVAPVVTAPTPGAGVSADAPTISNIYDVTASGGDLGGLDANVTLVLTALAAADPTGNLLASTTPTGANEHTFSLDNTAPTLTSVLRQTPSVELTNADSLVWRVSFSEAIPNVTAADFSITGSTAGVTQISAATAGFPPSVAGNTGNPVLAVASNAYDITVSGGDLASVDGSVGLAIAAGNTIADAVGNTLSGTTPTGSAQTYTLDNTAPTVTISTTASAPVAGPFAITVTFSEDVTGFDAGDLSAGNGTISGFTAGDARTYTATITPGTGSSVTIAIAGGVANDAAGNANSAAPAFSISHNPNRTLTVSRPGAGSGTVTSAPAGIDCGPTCSGEFEVSSSVTLTASAAPESSFAGWTDGPCTGSATSTCVVAMSSNQTVAARFTLDNPPAGRIVAATLPAARSGHVGGPVITAFLSVVSRSSSPAQSCRITAPAGAPATLGYRLLETGSSNVVGPQDPLFDIPNGGSLSFVLAMTPVSQTGAQGFEFVPVITCENASLDPIVGVNSVLLTIGAAPGPDILSISATPSGDGVIRIPGPGRTQFMTAAAINIGAGDGSAGAGEVTLSTSVDTGSAVLPLSLELCQVNAASICITPRGSSVSSTMPANTPLYFAVFARDTSAGSGIPFDPANARVFMRFADTSGTIRSATSAAVTAPAASDLPEIGSSLPTGRWSVLRRNGETLTRSHAFVLRDGNVLISDEASQITELVPLETLGRFVMHGHDGVWTNTGLIRLGQAWAERDGEFWGIRDHRSDRAVSWSDMAGDYAIAAASGGITISASGGISGSLAGCIVSGQGHAPNAGAPGLLDASITLMSCSLSGHYQAVMDLPANENGAAALVIAGEASGWRLVAD